MDDGIVAGQLLRQCRAERRAELLDRAWPIRETIERSTVAQHDRRVVTVAGVLELPLDVEDCPLCRSLAVRIFLTGNAPAENDAGGLRQYFDMFAERLPYQLEDGRFASTRPAGQNDPPSIMSCRAFAYHHGLLLRL